jgi:outer membrane protein assembly factor BamB
MKFEAKFQRAKAGSAFSLTPALSPRERENMIQRRTSSMPWNLLLVLTLGILPAAGADWATFLGPTANGISTETGLIDKWGEKGPPIVWANKMGTGYSAPSVRGKLIVAHHRVRGNEVIQAFDAETGKPVWDNAYPSQFEDPYGYNNGPRCTPLLTEDRCYTFGAEGRLTCVNLKDGKLIWARDTAKDFAVPPAFFGVGSTPILEGDNLIVMVGGQPNSGMVAFDPATGKTRWESVGKANWEGQPMKGWPGDRLYKWSGAEKSASYSTPVAVTIHGKRHVLCIMRQGLVSLNPTNGTVNFSRWFQSVGNDSVNAISPVVVDDLVFISAAYYRVGSVLMRVKPDGKSFDEVWTQPKEFQERDAESGSFVNPVLGIHWNTPIYHEGYLYAFDGRNEPDAHFKCVEFKTGKMMWDRNESWPPHSSPTPPVYGRGSAILADGKLITLGEGGLLGIFKLNPKRPEEICRWQVPQLNYPCWAAPVLANKKLYLRSEGFLVCLDFGK